MDDRASTSRIRMKSRSPFAVPLLIVAGIAMILVAQPPAVGLQPIQSSASIGDAIGSAETLDVGEEMLSPDHQYRAVMQGDGNFVVYRRGGGAIWSSKTAGSGANRVVVQSDGNVVVYAGSSPRWASNTHDTGTKTLVMQNDGNLVAYTAKGRATWSSKGGYVADRLKSGVVLHAGDGQLYSRNHQYRAVMQGDGNFVVYRRGGGAIWSSKTAGSGANRVVVQSDGNVVVYAGSSPRWASNTHDTGTKTLVMQNDGNLVAYAGSRPTWASKSGTGDQGGSSTSGGSVDSGAGDSGGSGSDGSASVACYGDYCSGQDPEASGCSADAVTIFAVAADTGGGRLELRWSETCKTNWARWQQYPTGWCLNCIPLAVLAEQDTGYTQKLVFSKTDGGDGPPEPGIHWTPMIYSPVHKVKAVALMPCGAMSLVGAAFDCALNMRLETPAG